MDASIETKLRAAGFTASVIDSDARDEARKYIDGFECEDQESGVARDTDPHGGYQFVSLDGWLLTTGAAEPRVTTCEDFDYWLDSLADED